MSKNKNIKSIHNMFERLTKLAYIEAEDIPSIELYMDQVTHFMDIYLGASKRFDSDKILTKTMINNYTKNSLLPPPLKKKYSKDHLILLIFIYYFKNILCINDISKLLKPITQQYFNEEGEISLSEVYDEIVKYLKNEESELFLYLKKKFKNSENLFKDMSDDLSEEKLEELRKFAFICYLSFDVYLKKMMIESLIDDYTDNE